MDITNLTKNFQRTKVVNISHVEQYPDAMIIYTVDDRELRLGFDSVEDKMDLIFGMLGVVKLNAACDYAESYPAMMRSMRNLVKATGGV